MYVAQLLGQLRAWRKGNLHLALGNQDKLRA